MKTIIKIKELVSGCVYGYVIADSKDKEKIEKFLQDNINMNIEDESKNINDIEEISILDVLEKLQDSNIKCEVIKYLTEIKL